MQRTTILILLSALAFTSVADAQPKKPKPTCGATSFADCPAKGCGGDPELNRKKNTKAKPSAQEVDEWELKDIVGLTFPQEWKSGTKRGLLEKWGEGRAVRVKAFLIHAKNYPSGVESCNCNLKKTDNNDFHLVLVDSRKKGEASSVTAEISPRIRPAGWTIEKLRKLSKDKAYVRVTGWVMLDTQHIKKPIKRLTNWEIHPVTRFEVCTGTVKSCDQGEGWEDLEEIP
jgi:hypothetical protein